ncbi:MAG TPA: PHP domain-containing protein [bacterium]
MERLVDLHLHTHYSDGTEAPEAVLELARGAGLAAAAITDHDNIDALSESEAAAAARGIELIPGIEMSSSEDGIEVHILGYLFDPAHAAFRAHLERQQARRVRRVHETAARLRSVGVEISAEEVLALAGKGTVGRPHVARVLRKHGYVSSTSEAFERFIGPGNPGFIPGSTVAPATIIALIREAGGVPVLAHPVYVKRDDMIARFASQGLAGLETHHSSHTPEQVRRYERMADDLGLLKTGGSDFHGVGHKEGAAVGAARAPYACLEALRRWHASHRAAA